MSTRRIRSFADLDAMKDHVDHVLTLRRKDSTEMAWTTS